MGTAEKNTGIKSKKYFSNILTQTPYFNNPYDQANSEHLYLYLLPYSSMYV